MFAESTLIIVEKRSLSSCVCTLKRIEENIGQVYILGLFVHKGNQHHCHISRRTLTPIAYSQPVLRIQDVYP
jgi:hypothetical protein